jgi:hypothetical protein
VAEQLGLTRLAIKRRIARWRREANGLERKLKARPWAYSERAIGEAQGVMRELLTCAMELEVALARAEGRRRG